MKNKCNKVKDTCGTLILADCTSYEGTTNTVSPLNEDCSLSIQETTQDIYTQLEEINLEALEDSVLNYVKTTDGRVLVKNAFIKIDAEIITLKQRVTVLENTSLCDKNIVGCNLQWGSLVDNCGDQPTTLKATIDLILNKLNTP